MVGPLRDRIGETPEQSSRRSKMSGLLQNKTLLILPVVFAILIAVGLLTT